MCFRQGETAIHKNVAVAVFIIGMLVTSIVLLSLSIKDVASDEWALNYGRTTRHVRGEVMGPGRQTLQPDSQLITFKNTFVPWDIEIDCWTSDGLEVELQIAIQTRYVDKEIKDIFFEFGYESDFKPYVSNVLEKLMRETCSNYTSFDYYNQRGAVQSDMLNRIETHLPSLGTHITTGGFLQLKNIKLPDSFNQAILDRRSAEQDIQVAANQRAQQLIIANTKLSQAINTGTIIVNDAELTSDAILFDAQQQALAIESKYDQRLLVYQIAIQSLNMTGDEYINKVLLVQLMGGNRTSTTVFV